MVENRPGDCVVKRLMWAVKVLRDSIADKSRGESARFEGGSWFLGEVPKKENSNPIFKSAKAGENEGRQGAERVDRRQK